MKENLKDDILNACRRYERDHILTTLKDILRENSSQSMREHFNMKPCPICGHENVHITNVMKRVEGSNPTVIAKMGFCTNCKFHSQKVYRGNLGPHYTEVSWTIAAVQVWNSTVTTSFFEVCERTFGEDYQYACNNEEVLELIEALVRYGKLTARDRRFDRRQTDTSIVSEMADVIICIYQLLHTRKVSSDVLNNVMREKINRTCQHESVRTAIAELSKCVSQMTSIAHAPSAEDSSAEP